MTQITPSDTYQGETREINITLTNNVSSYGMIQIWMVDTGGNVIAKYSYPSAFDTSHITADLTLTSTKVLKLKIQSDYTKNVTGQIRFDFRLRAVAAGYDPGQVKEFSQILLNILETSQNAVNE